MNAGNIYFFAGLYDRFTCVSSTLIGAQVSNPVEAVCIMRTSVACLNNNLDRFRSWIARVELFNGRGVVIEGYIDGIDRTGIDFLASEEPKVVAPKSIQWDVFAAFGELSAMIRSCMTPLLFHVVFTFICTLTGSLKGGRGDWLVEKCTVWLLPFLASPVGGLCFCTP